MSVISRLLDRMEVHAALAGWLSAIGGIAAIIAAFLVSYLQNSIRPTN